MSSDRTRTGLILLCLLAIGLAAAQFPATGVGSLPDGGGPFVADGGGDPVDRPSDTGGRDITTRAATPTESAATTTATPTAEPTDTTTNDATGADHTPTVAASASDHDDRSLPIAPLFVVIVFGATLASGAILVRAGVITAGGRLGRDGEGSGPPVDARVPDALSDLFRGETTVHGLVQRIPQVTMSFVIDGSSRVPPAMDAVGRVTGAVAGGVATAVQGSATALGNAVGTGRKSLGNAAFGVGKGLALGLAAAPAGASSLLGGLFGGDSSTIRSTDRPDSDARDAAGLRSDGDDDPPGPPATIDEAWIRMLDRADLSRRRSKTPVELAGDLIRSGLPSEPVSRLTTLFRQRRYGDVPTTDERLQAARDALSQVGGGENS